MAKVKIQSLGNEILKEIMLKPARKKKFLEEVGKFVQEKSRFILDASVGHKTNLAKSIQYEVRGNRVSIFSPLKYAPSVEFGTRPHMIRPKKAKALHWKGEFTGDDIFAQKVQHPGSRAVPHMRPAMMLLKKELPRIMKKV